jgi:hypothetical protein
MSIESLVNRFGMTLYLYRPSTSVGVDGEVSRTYSRVCEFRGFVNTSSQSSNVAMGRAEGRTQATIYVPGSLDVRIDDEIRDGFYGTVRNWRVTGANVPGEVIVANSAAHLAMTVVDAVEVEPGVTL